jgi:hypothetical protein
MARPPQRTTKSRAKAQPRAAPRPPGDVAALQRALETARNKLAVSEKARRAALKENDELRREKDLLEEQLVQLVKEIGHLKFLTERSDLLESEAKLREQKIAELSADVDRLRASLTSGRPTALAAAAAASGAEVPLRAAPLTPRLRGSWVSCCRATFDRRSGRQTDPRPGHD